MKSIGHIESVISQKIYRQIEIEAWGKKGISYTNWLIVWLIIFSIVLFTAETEKEIYIHEPNFFWTANLIVLLIFCLEFVLRIYSVGANPNFKGLSGRISYVIRNWKMLFVDFVAFAPELVFLVIGLNFPSWLRLLRIFRLFKISRYFPVFKLVLDALKGCAQELLVSLSLSSVAWYLGAVALYFSERTAQPDNFGSITRAMWWSIVTLTTVGYGDTHPITVPGKVCAGLLAVVAVGIVALPGGIIAGAFIERFRARRESNSVVDASPVENSGIGVPGK